MDPFKHIGAALSAALEELAADGKIPSGLDLRAVAVETPRDPAHGDVSHNAAMVLAKPAQLNPRALADLLAPRLAGAEGVTGVGIAGPGFINLTLSEDFWRRTLGAALDLGEAFGASGIGKDQRVNVEYVSA